MIKNYKDYIKEDIFLDEEDWDELDECVFSKDDENKLEKNGYSLMNDHEARKTINNQYLIVVRKKCKEGALSVYSVNIYEDTNRRDLIFKDNLISSVDNCLTVEDLFKNNDL